VNGSQGYYAHDQEIEGALREVEAVVGFLHAYRFYIYAAQV
jgi:hypothetical protein